MATIKITSGTVTINQPGNAPIILNITSGELTYEGTVAVPPDPLKELNAILDQLLDLDEGLTPKEADFIENLAQARTKYGTSFRVSPAQEKWLRDIAARHL